MNDHQIKNLIGRDLINLREVLSRCRPIVAESAKSSEIASSVLARIDMLIYRHADPELDVAKRWAVGDYLEWRITTPIDEHTCPHCAAMDGRKLTADTPFTELPPFRQCTNPYGCRCQADRP